MKKEINSREDCEWFGLRTPQKPCGQCNKNCQYNNNKTQKDCKKVKEIEEMARIICGFVHSENICDCVNKHKCNGKCTAYYDCELLYKAGYRKVIKNKR